MSASPTPLPPRRLRSFSRLLLLFVLLAGGYFCLSNWLVLRSLELHRDALAHGKLPSAVYPAGPVHWQLEVTQNQEEGKGSKGGSLVITEEGQKAHFRIDIKGQKESPVLLWRDENGSLALHAASTGATFRALQADPAPVQLALAESATLLPRLGWKEKLGLFFYTFPRISGAYLSEDKNVCFVIQTRLGPLHLFSNGAPRLARLHYKEWAVKIDVKPVYAGDSLPDEVPSERVPGEEMMLSLAEAIRIGVYNFTPINAPVDGRTTSGAGWMEVRDGHRQLYLSGTPYEIGLQHGELAGDGVGRMANRLVYGVGLLYSIKQKEWFPTAAKKLVERQRPFIQAAYFEEMRGLSEGTGLPLDLIQMVNIFPEFFHCSGVALMGEATKGGTLLHARVLDYMVGVGLQDEAAVMAIEQPGKNRFVTVGYLGFIGSVTGMNEHQVAIGEMGGAGQGDWDGIPMSLLIRQGLEDFDTLEGVEKFMRESPRTCEYYYVLSDGKGPSAVGIAATPEKFETFGPGEFHERLQQPVDHAVLLSGPGRYEKLVERVKADYGSIDLDKLIEIIKRPVSMKSNLHNVIFEPQTLRLAVADASRHHPACNEPYRLYTWDALFPPSVASAR